jgi:hypothetical protein
MNWLKKVMYGRYGGDHLSRALLILSFILIVIAGALPRSLSGLLFIGYIPTFVCIFRIFSRDIYKRQQENYKYLKIKNSVVTGFKQKLNRAKDSKTYKYFTCPDCKQKLRVPRGQGKISVTCPKCKKSFKGKS